MKKILTIIGTTLLLFGAIAVYAQQNIEDVGINVADAGYQYFYVNGAGVSGALWPLTVSQTDTSALYRIEPGLFYTAKCKVASPSGDTCVSMQIWYADAPDYAAGRLVDSFSNNTIGLYTTTAGGWRDFWGGSAGLKYPVNEGRYVFFVATNDNQVASTTTYLQMEVFSSVEPRQK